MKGRLPLIFSLIALFVAVTGFTGLGEAARDALPRASFANNSHRVDGIHASRRPRAGYLYPLGRNRKFPAAVIGTGPAGPPGVSALEIVTLATASDSSTPKTAAATCPAGKKVVGGGARALPEQRHPVDGAGEGGQRRRASLDADDVRALRDRAVARFDRSGAVALCAAPLNLRHLWLVLPRFVVWGKRPNDCGSTLRFQSARFGAV